MHPRLSPAVGTSAGNRWMLPPSCAGQAPSSRNSPPAGIAPAARSAITPALSAPTIAHNPSSTQEHPWAKATASGGSRSNSSPAQCSLPNAQHGQHAGTPEYVFHFSHFWSVLSASLGFWGRHRQSSWERQHASFSVCYCH